jgi:hypothetical protein
VISKLQVRAVVSQKGAHCPDYIPGTDRDAFCLSADFGQALNTEEIRRLAANIDHTHRPGCQIVIRDAASIIKGSSHQRAKWLGNHSTLSHFEGLGVAPFTSSSMNAYQPIMENSLVVVECHR